MTEKKQNNKPAKAIDEYRQKVIKLENRVKELQAEARERKQHFELTKRAGLLGTWEYDVNQGTMYVDESLKKVFGYDERDIESALSSWTDFVHPEDLVGLRDAVLKTFKSRSKKFEFTHRLIQKDGNYRWVIARGTALKDKKGKVYRILGMDVDISKYKLMENDLKQRIEIEKVIAEISSDFINLGPGQLDTELNEALAKIGMTSGVDRCYIFQFYEKGKLLTNTHEWCSPGIKSEKKNSQQLSISQFPWYGKQVKNFKTVLIDKVSEIPKRAEKEKIRWNRQGIKSILLVPMVYADEVTGFIGFEAIKKEKKWFDEDIRFLKVLSEIFINAINRIASDRLLLENEKQYRTLFELSPSGIMLEDANGIILDANPSYCSSLGYQKEELVGQSVRMLAQPSAVGDISKNIAILIEGKELLHVVKSYRKDGSFCFMELSEKGITLSDGSSGILCVANDISDRVEAENALRESEERYRNLIENTPNGVAVHQEGILVYVNPSALKIIGAESPDQALGLDAIDFVHPDFREIAKKRADDLNANKWTKNPVEEKYIRFDGTEIDVESTIIKIVFKDKPAFLVVFRDITEQKKIEDALRQSENYFRGLFENSPISLWEIDFSSIKDEIDKLPLKTQKKLKVYFRENPGYIKRILKKVRIVDVNLATIKLFAARKKANIFSNYLQAFTSDTIHTITQAIISLNGGKDNFHSETTAVTLKGEKLFLTFDLFIAPGYIRTWKRVVFSFTDITNLMKAEQAVRESEHRFRNIFENALIGIYQTTPEGKILMANEAMIKMLGYDSLNEVLQLSIDKDGFAKGYNREAFIKKIEEEGVITGHETAWKKKTGEILHIRESARVVRDEKGNILFYEGTVEDITERKHLETLLQQAQKIEAVGQLAGGIAHDFNNLLTIISGRSELALMKIGENSQEYGDIKAIQAAAERAGKLTRKLLGFSRKQMIEPQMIDLNSAIREHLEMIHSFVGENIKLEVEYQAENASIIADSNQIEQILLNLAINARDALSEKKGKGKKRITIRTKNIFIDDELLTLHPFNHTGPHVVMSISDNGVGMTEEVRMRIFDPFFTTKSVEKGTGLGLASVYGIIRQNNAGIYVHSKKDFGSTFKIVWPIFEDTSAPDNVSEKEKKIEKGEGSILFVEDEVGVRNFACSALRLMGYKVVEAANGAEAIEILEEESEQFDLIVTDLIMPEMGGSDLAEEVQKKYPQIKVLFTSGYSDSELIFGERDMDELFFMHKPYSISEMALKISQVMSSKQ